MQSGVLHANRFMTGDRAWNRGRKSACSLHTEHTRPSAHSTRNSHDKKHIPHSTPHTEFPPHRGSLHTGLIPHSSCLKRNFPPHIIPPHSTVRIPSPLNYWLPDVIPTRDKRNTLMNGGGDLLTYFSSIMIMNGESAVCTVPGRVYNVQCWSNC